MERETIRRRKNREERSSKKKLKMTVYVYIYNERAVANDPKVDSIQTGGNFSSVEKKMVDPYGGKRTKWTI